MKDKESKVEIQKIKIKIDDIRIDLTPSQALKLSDTLSKLFGTSKTVIEHHYPDNKWYWPWNTYYGTNVSSAGSLAGLTNNVTLSANSMEITV